MMARPMCFGWTARRISEGLPRILRLALMLASVVAPLHSSWAVDIPEDPNGFGKIPWGSSLENQTFLKKTFTSTAIQEYQPTDAPPHLADIPVTSVKYSSLQGEFARVTIRYQGESTHKQILAYLERQYGALDKTPGQMVRGLNQQYNWRGIETEINLTYEGHAQRGFVFFDSRVLAPRFNDGITDSSE